MQDVSSTNKVSILASMTEGTLYSLYDSRDGKEYQIAKLADGNVWMMQNLDLDLSANVTYTNENTDLGYNSSSGEYETASWRPTASTATNANGWTVSNFVPSSYDTGDLYWNGNESDWNDWEDYYDTCVRDTATGKLTCDESFNPFSTYVGSTGIPQYHLGNYYNWSAAVATNDSSVYNGSVMAENSICPTGWRLPDVDTFFDLWAEYGFTTSSINGSDKLWTEPLYFPLSGGYNIVMDYVGSDGAFWSLEARGDSEAWGVDYADDGWMDSLYGRRSYGHSVRCIVR